MHRSSIATTRNSLGTTTRHNNHGTNINITVGSNEQRIIQRDNESSLLSNLPTIRNESILNNIPLASTSELYMDRFKDDARNSNSHHPRTPLEFLDVTETDLTETTDSARSISADIVVESNTIIQSPVVTDESVILPIQCRESDEYEYYNEIIDHTTNDEHTISNAPIQSESITTTSISLEQTMRQLQRTKLINDDNVTRNEDDRIGELIFTENDNTTILFDNDRLSECNNNNNNLQQQQMVAVITEYNQSLEQQQYSNQNHINHNQHDDNLDLALQNNKDDNNNNENSNVIYKSLHNNESNCCFDKSIDHTYHLSSYLISENDDIHSNNNSDSWTEEECGTATSSDFLILPKLLPQGNIINHTNNNIENVRNNCTDNQRRRQGKTTNDVDDEKCNNSCCNSDTSSACTLNIITCSCNSSVTWYEGSDIDEIDITINSSTIINNQYDDDIDDENELSSTFT